MSSPSVVAAAGVGIVVVSHSRALAAAAVDLAREMLHGQEARIAVAAGLDDTTFGTDAVQIATAIEQVDGEAGVVVLMDLGSAVLSAELSLELLGEDVRERVLLCPAPLVEGLIVAAVAAAGGSAREDVAAEAQGALLGKTGHLAPVEARPGTGDPPAPGLVASFVVANAHGIHARPAARLVAEVRRLDAVVTLRNTTTGRGPVPAGSLSRVATLGALQGHEVEVIAAGRQARAALDHVLALAARRFDEEPGGEAPASPWTARADAEDGADGPVPPPVRHLVVGPLPAAPGVAIGPSARFMESAAPVDDRPAGPPAREWRRFVEAVADTRRRIERSRAAAARAAGAEEAGIFDAHLMLLDDGELLDAVRPQVDAGESAASAWAVTVAAVEAEWATLPDPYLRARAADVRAVGDQVLRALAGDDAEQTPDVDGILVAGDLTPAQAAALDTERILAVVLAGGSATSHAAILVRSLGIPAVVAAGPEVLDLPVGTLLVVDGTAGVVLVDPAPELVDEYGQKARRLDEQRARDGVEASRQAVTRDGEHIVVGANIGSVADARAAASAGADGAGLVRTEFLFLDRDRPPTADEQDREYRAMVHALAGRPVTLRTLDVGGDKPLRYLPQPREVNPFLGQRGLRLSLTRPDLFRDQLAAVCRVARTTPVKIMFPMVSVVEELLAGRRLLSDAAGPEGLPEGLQVGMMVEVPSAALNIEAFLPHLDFVSIGTNDLTQYTLAAERGHPALAGLADPLDPAVLRLIAEVGTRAAGRATVSVCGEVAADELAVPVLLGLGVTELSVASSAVPMVKAVVRRLDREFCAALARRCLVAGSAEEVRRLASTAALQLDAAALGRVPAEVRAGAMRPAR